MPNKKYHWPSLGSKSRAFLKLATAASMSLSAIYAWDPHETIKQILVYSSRGS
jgi:hypothetical protein